MYEVYGGMLKEDIHLTINGQAVTCPPGLRFRRSAI